MIKTGLRTRWVISITILIIFLASGLSFFLIQRLKISERENIIRYGFTLANNLAYNSEYGVLIANEEILITLIQGVMREKDVVYCIIQDLEGNIFSQGGEIDTKVVLGGALNRNAVQSQRPIQQFYVPREGSGIYDIVAPIFTSTVEGAEWELEFFVTPEGLRGEKPPDVEKIGIARVGISMASANRRMANTQKAATLTTFIIILIGIGVTYILVGAVVTPIDRLVEGTQIVAKGDLSHRVSITSKDEIGDLGRAFNQMTEDLKISHDKLLDNIAELKSAQFKLIQAEKMEVVGRLASGIAHEVKNPLAIILQCVEYLSKNVYTENKNVSMTMDYIKDAVKRADDVVRSLLDFSSMSKMDLRLCDLNSIIDRALLLLKHQFDKNHIHVIKQLKDDVPRVELDENRIEQVFVNLFLNSAAAMPKGGELKVKDYVDEEEGRQKELIVQIEDTGEGISEEAMGSIFEPFFTTRREEGGTGLGLSVVRNIIDLHNGRIYIENREKNGVRVTLAFKI